jgi:hypothetical protein
MSAAADVFIKDKKKRSKTAKKDSKDFLIAKVQQQ